MTTGALERGSSEMNSSQAGRPSLAVEEIVVVERWMNHGLEELVNVVVRNALEALSYASLADMPTWSKLISYVDAGIGEQTWMALVQPAWQHRERH